MSYSYKTVSHQSFTLDQQAIVKVLLNDCLTWCTRSKYAPAPRDTPAPAMPAMPACRMALGMKGKGFVLGEIVVAVAARD